VLQELQWQADATGELDWSLHHVDGTVIRAHQHAAGDKKGTTTSGEAMAAVEHMDEALGRSKGGFSTKIHLRSRRWREAYRPTDHGGAAA
jgi:hypothetical protein